MKPLLPRFFRMLGMFIGGGINFLLVLLFPTPFHYFPLFLLGLMVFEFLRELIRPRHESIAQDVVNKFKS